MPFYPGLHVGVPSLPARRRGAGRRPLRPRARLLARARPGVAAALIARDGGCRWSAATTPSSPPTRGCAPATRRCEARRSRSRAFYGALRVVLSPSAAADALLAALGHRAERVGCAGTAASTPRASRPAPRAGRCCPATASTSSTPGRLTREKGADLLADAFLAARERDPRLHLVLAGGGPEEAALRERLGEHATFLGWLEGDELARAYASADMFLFASRTDTFGQVMLEAQASGLPVVAVAEGGPAELVARRRARPAARARRPSALGDGGRRPRRRARAARAVARGGRRAVASERGRPLARLAAGWRARAGKRATCRRRAGSPDGRRVRGGGISRSGEDRCRSIGGCEEAATAA